MNKTKHITQEGWIPVTERMPEPGTECLVYGPHWFSEEPCIRMDVWDEQHEAPVGFSSATIPVGLGWCDSAFEDVTHWMPLPPPPTQEGGGMNENADGVLGTEAPSSADAILRELVEAHAEWDAKHWSKRSDPGAADRLLKARRTARDYINASGVKGLDRG